MPHRSVLYEIVVHAATGAWGVSCPTDQSLIGPVQYGWDRYQIDRDSMTFGGGLLAGSPLPGTRRMIVCGHSPQWEGFYVSALGGAMYVFRRLGANYLWLREQAPTDSILILNLKNGEYSARLEPVDVDALWRGYTDATGRAWEGFYALQRYAFEAYGAEYAGDDFRILATGPAARHTKEGAIGSNAVKKGTLSVVDDWAGRGGLGSRMLQHHRIAAIVFGGDWNDPDMKAGKELDQYFLDHFGMRAIQADLILSQKYRYVPEFDTGGTFGVNMHTLNDRLLSHNYQSIYAPEAERLQQHDALILGHYLKQFNDEIVKPRNFDHCGEPCAIACKKFVGEYKKDYEPYAALGPLCGIFDQRAAERLNKFVDTMGLDAIQAGGLVAWVMELLTARLIQPEAFGLPLDLPNFSPAPWLPLSPAVLSPDTLASISAHNADYAIAILKMVLFTEAGAPFRRGLRAAAKWLDEKYGIDSLNRAVFTAHGAEGCMTPNQYWTPGMFAPMPLMGKYFSYYENKFLPPRALGRKNVERFVYEFYSENAGACRFHRKWTEDIVDEIILSHFQLNFDYWRDNFTLAKAIHDHQSAQGVFWESERVVDLIATFIFNWENDGLRDPDLLAWAERFRADKWAAARAFWQELYDGMAEAFANGLGEPTHVAHGSLKK
jgi:glyceraldehyde-3-phosphate dehydrogenase (ferredoxin)